MTSTESGRSLVVVQLSGGNDYVNTIVPYTNGRYYDARPNVNIPEDQVLPINGALGFSSSMEPIKGLWDQETVAIIHGVGYPNPNRSHFRSTDVWHTAVPETIGKDGWLGRTIGRWTPAARTCSPG